MTSAVVRSPNSNNRSIGEFKLKSLVNGISMPRSLDLFFLLLLGIVFSIIALISSPLSANTCKKFHPLGRMHLTSWTSCSSST